MGRPTLATTFKKAEVALVLDIANTLQRGGDVSVLARSTEWRNVVAKFRRMQLKVLNA